MIESAKWASRVGLDVRARVRVRIGLELGLGMIIPAHALVPSSVTLSINLTARVRLALLCKVSEWSISNTTLEESCPIHNPTPHPNLHANRNQENQLGLNIVRHFPALVITQAPTPS